MRGLDAKRVRRGGLGLALLAAVALAGCAGGQTGPATNVSSGGATLNGSVSSSADGDVSYWFAYGKTASYGSETTHRTISISDRNAHPVSEPVSGLDAGTIYHYQLCAQASGSPVSCGQDVSFTTHGPISTLQVSAQPALYPNFDPAVSDYVVRCDGRSPVTMTVAAPNSTQVAIDGQPAQSGSFTQDVQLAFNQGFSFSTTTGGQTQTYHVRCLPPAFPKWTFSRSGTPSQDWTLVAPSLGPSTNHFLAFFDANGVPVWWYKADVVPVDAKLLSDNTVAFGTGGGAFGLSQAGPYEVRRLDGSLVRTLQTVGSPTDFHDLQQLPNGDYLMDTYVLRNNVDLSPYGGPSDATIADPQVQEIAPDGSLVWSWSTKDHISLDETAAHWWPSILANAATLPDGTKVYDPFHLNSIEPDGDSLIISLRHADAIYRISLSDGSVEWKLGGTTTPQGLTVIGDDQTSVFGGQHDARRLADGTVSVHDNGTGLGRAPRVLRFQIDPVQKTATLVETLSDPQVTGSGCCGSARKLDSGGWLVDWGGTPVVAEYASDGSRVFKLQFSGVFSYRAFPVAHGRISADSLRQGMDAMFPR